MPQPARRFQTNILGGAMLGLAIWGFVQPAVAGAVMGACLGAGLSLAITGVGLAQRQQPRTLFAWSMLGVLTGLIVSIIVTTVSEQMDVSLAGGLGAGGLAGAYFGIVDAQLRRAWGLGRDFGPIAGAVLGAALGTVGGAMGGMQGNLIGLYFRSASHPDYPAILIGILGGAALGLIVSIAESNATERLRKLGLGLILGVCEGAVLGAAFVVAWRAMLT